MDTATLKVWRRGGLTPMPSEQELIAHQERSLLLHGMRHALGIGVLNWGEVDE